MVMFNVKVDGESGTNEDQGITDQRNVSDIGLLNGFYINVTSHIGVPDAMKENDNVSEIVEHHCNHPSNEFIKNNVDIMDVFDLVSNEDILKKLKS